MALTTGRSGKCSNFGNCSLADARKNIEVPAGLDFVCPECSKPLLLSETGAAGGNSKVWVVGVLLFLLMAAGGVTWALFFREKPAAPAPNVPEVQATTPLPTPSPPAPAGDTPQPSISGDCSDADAAAKLCTKPKP